MIEFFMNTGVFICLIAMALWNTQMMITNLKNKKIIERYEELFRKLKKIS